MNVASLFANIGVAEAYLKEIGFDVVVANELIKRRADLYKKIYPHCDMINGSILEDRIQVEIINKCIYSKVDVIMATPPCQGMSSAGQQIKYDERNSLTLPALHIIKKVSPKYALIENVPGFLNTSILIDGNEILLPNLIKRILGKEYRISFNIINTEDYSVPQTRERMVVLLTRNDIEKDWIVPKKECKKITLEDSIGWIPIIDPYIKDIDNSCFTQLFPLYEKRKKVALEVSKWNIPPIHIYRQVIVMQHTPTGCTAFDNKKYKPYKKDGTYVKGYHNTYKRQNWNTPAYTITMDNRKISSQNNVHPGRYLGKDKNGEIMYSDARTLTLFEIMLLMSLPQDWPLPNEVSEPFVRRIIGEGIPPLFIKKLFRNII